ncbi:hypothetical protein SKAU_G00143290 [Synaphobranchus kaupii]|uniref:Uncharacterized protein n=1 Tax=Synaphobranchus kaupii TaxID=118154 RepID=A0A9Q1FTR9_SYNKA|nr:hypothetical protein SKAU_G00143290 [Synaphobranchus kaupii]
MRSATTYAVAWESPSCRCNRVKQLDGDLMHSEARRTRALTVRDEWAGGGTARPVYYSVFLLDWKPVMIATLLD